MQSGVKRWQFISESHRDGRKIIKTFIDFTYLYHFQANRSHRENDEKQFQFPVSIPVTQLLPLNIFMYYDVRASEICVEFPENLTDNILYTRIIKMDGTEVMTETKNSGLKSITIAIPDISPGIYLVVISDNNKVIQSIRIPVTR